ncbi:MAG: alginate export family protein [Gluconobacter potus]|uniref:Alginate export family protein n=1 Tax=Gluconobacter potus TaxID=2724927 RepID=A0ABR9YMU9_9PROT|nr:MULTISPECIES: alginate export family protein [Gluconobacter]MBF0864814.1 alginate export family protein [Gluconobacter sp. R71656]MBF0867969.1 alginate export family protein [Gluconobacter sp. R75628]MBF0873951.1 alginate export family protein [Gluconobacter sp. R75629]MBF0882928.1 alginate export family protein [Gluconobacter potus]
MSRHHSYRNRSLLALMALEICAPHVAVAAQPSSPAAPVTPAQVTQTEEWIHVPSTERPPIQNYPHAGVVGQPRRVVASQNHAPQGRQGPWGAFSYGNGESAGFGPVGRYGVAPWAEDWSFLRDKSRRDDPFDPLKFIALNDAKTIWLSFSGETRLRNWYEETPFLGKKGGSNSGRFGVRNLYGADLHLGEHVRLFGQLINADAGGWKGFGYNTTYRKRLDLQQAFIEFKGKLAGAQTGFMFGRQQFLDAPSYVLYNRETPNVPLSWNGGRIYAIWPNIRVDAFDFVQTKTDATLMFHDTEDYGTRLYGGDITALVPQFFIGGETVHSFLDIFYYGYRYGGSLSVVPLASGSLKGTSSRGNVGFRWYGTAASFEYSFGGLYQDGTFQKSGSEHKSAVQAYSVNTIVGYRHTPSPLHPFIGVQADLYSGGADGTNGPVQTYMAPFNPQTNYLDTTTYIQPSNLVSVSPVLSVTPWKGFASIQFKVPFMWRDNADGAIWNSSGPYTFSKTYHGGYIGVVPQASLKLQLNRHLTWQIYGARFMASNGLHAAGGKSGSYAQSNVVFRF